jgi:5-exo-hydroxycamphor dehydrogenase
MLCADVNWPPVAGTPNGAAYREVATVSPRAALYRIPAGTPSESVIAFGCAMPTAITGLDRLGDLGRHVVIQGCGPVGLASTLLARVAGAETITVIGDPERRLDIAERMGATATLELSSTTQEERRTRIREITGGDGATSVIEAAGQAAAFPEGVGLLGMNGRYLVLGLYAGSEKIPFDPVPVNNLNLHIVGSLGYAHDALSRAVHIATEYGEQYGFAGLVSHRFPLERTQDAIECAARGDAVKTIVLPPSADAGR